MKERKKLHGEGGKLGPVVVQLQLDLPVRTDILELAVIMFVLLNLVVLVLVAATAAAATTEVGEGVLYGVEREREGCVYGVKCGCMCVRSDIRIREAWNVHYTL